VCDCVDHRVLALLGAVGFKQTFKLTVGQLSGRANNDSLIAPVIATIPAAAMVAVA
jgi:hypothetical protein